MQVLAGTNLYDYGARFYNPRTGMWLTRDPQADDYKEYSPYVFCAGNPVNVVDLDGLSPIYDEDGGFLGTDDEGLTGDYIVMNKQDFIQGMSHADALDYCLSNFSEEVKTAIEAHYSELPTRPDYDGYLTISEGIRWAKSHPYALQNPTPDNTLYLDAGKLDFGLLETAFFSEEGIATPVELFTFKTILKHTITDMQH